jgi:flavin reductase (DIM6/NTAB) family NADH-FMN oxidoreductase RutF
MNLKKIKVEKIHVNPFTLIDKEWMLIAAGTSEAFNMMTASWGGLGTLWNKSVCYVFIRPTRLTYKFMENNETFSINFFEEKYRKVLNLCGSKSGREINKMFIPELTVTTENGAVYFNEARLVFICKKLYFQDIDPKNFMEPEIDKNYAKKDYHRMYIGEILQAYEKQ